MKKLLVILIIMAMAGCIDNGGSSNRKKDNCAGPVKCLKENWGNQYYVFYDQYNNPVVIQSNGKASAISYFSEIGHEIVLVVFAGPVKDCYSANMNRAGIDFDCDGNVDIMLSGVTGKFKVCKRTIKTYGFESNEFVFENIIAYYDHTASLSHNALSTDAPICAENVDKIKMGIWAIEQLSD